MIEPINRNALAIQKKRARLAAVDMLRLAYMDASERHDLTRKDFAERIGMSPSQFSRILNGSQNITIETAEAILRSLGARIKTDYQNLEDISPMHTNRYFRDIGAVTRNKDGRYTKESAR